MNDADHLATTATPIPLQAGQRYGVLILLKEGGGGDWLRVAWRHEGDTTAAADLPYLPGQFLSTYVDPNTDIQFVKQPTDQPGTRAFHWNRNLRARLQRERRRIHGRGHDG